MLPVVHKTIFKYIGRNSFLLRKRSDRNQNFYIFDELNVFFLKNLTKSGYIRIYDNQLLLGDIFILYN